MAKNDDDSPIKISDKALLKSLQELNVTLELLKTLAVDLKDKCEPDWSKTKPQQPSNPSVTETHTTLQ